METTIEIKSIYGDVLYKHTCEDNSVKKTLEEVVKSHSNLIGADLREANLIGADLCGADMRDADLRGADLYNVKADSATAMFFPQCPDGEFIGYKKAEGKIVKLLIPEDAKRSSATTLKCRCSKAKVLEIQEIDGSPSEVKEVRSNYDKNFVYRLGETVCVEDFDDDRWHECSIGIHFFISREAAVSYEG
jgi:hypothetical protein